MTRLVQVSVESGIVRECQPEDPAPVLELHLDDHQRVVQVELWQEPLRRERKTVDWHWKAVIESRL